MATKKSVKPIRILYQFLRVRNVSGSLYGNSPYDLCARELERDHLVRPEGFGDKGFVMKNLDYIAAIAGPVPPKHRKTPKTRQSTRSNESSVKAYISRSNINPTSDDFLQSFEWRAVRMMALKLNGARCQCCGASPKTGAVLNVDHIKPRKTHPQLALDINNLQVLCGDCNHGKGNWDETDWR